MKKSFKPEGMVSMARKYEPATGETQESPGAWEGQPGEATDHGIIFLKSPWQPEGRAREA